MASVMFSSGSDGDSCNSTFPFRGACAKAVAAEVLIGVNIGTLMARVLLTGCQSSGWEAIPSSSRSSDLVLVPLTQSHPYGNASSSSARSNARYASAR